MACEHEWVWLPKPEFTLDEGANLLYAENVECVKCTERGWAHGQAGYRTTTSIITNPTTGGTTA